MRPDPTKLRGATYFRKLIESLATGLEARDTSLYRELDHERWAQSTTPGEWSHHLEFWTDLGGQVLWRGHHYDYSGRLLFAVSYQPSDDSRGQARLHAAIRDAMEYLLTTPFYDDARVTDILAVQIVGPIGDMLEITIPYTLQLPR